VGCLAARPVTPFRDTFATRALAESFRSKLIVAQREGVAFDEACGLPEPMARALNARSWYDHAIAYVDMKWARASAKHRKGIAETLATVTPALPATDRGAPAHKVIRAALYGWVFNKARRDAGPPPDAPAAAVHWLEANTVDLSALADAALVRKALDSHRTTYQWQGRIREQGGIDHSLKEVGKIKAGNHGQLGLEAHEFDRRRIALLRQFS
jgi:hypothetical protein